MQTQNSEIKHSIIVTPEDLEELKALSGRVRTPNTGRRRRGRKVIDWNEVMKPKAGEEPPESLLDRISDIDLSWLPGVLNEAVERGKQKKKNGKWKIDKEYVEKEIAKRVLR